jgi:hypothetical protein
VGGLFKRKLKKVQVLAAALQAYRKACSKGIFFYLGNHWHVQGFNMDMAFFFRKWTSFTQRKVYKGG